MSINGPYKETGQKLDPCGIWFFNDLYLIGQCHVRSDFRNFALDRIKIFHPTKDTFEVPEDFSFEEFITPSFGVFQGKPIIPASFLNELVPLNTRSKAYFPLAH